MTRRHPPEKPSLDPVVLVDVKPHVERKIARHLKENRPSPYRDPREPRDEFTRTEKAQIRAALVADHFPEINRAQYVVQLAREMRRVHPVVVAPDVDDPGPDSLDAWLQPEGVRLWRRWTDPLVRTDGRPAAVGAKAVAVWMVAHAPTHARKALSTFRGQLQMQAGFNALNEAAWEKSGDDDAAPR